MYSDLICFIFWGMGICLIPLILFFEFYHWVRNQKHVEYPYVKGIVSGFCLGVILSIIMINTTHGESGLAAVGITPFIVLGFILSGVVVAKYYKWLNRTLLTKVRKKDSRTRKDLKDKLKFPLFAIADLDVIAYNSIEALETDLEGIDVADGLYKSFDAEGRLINLEAIGAKRGRFMVAVGYAQLTGVEDIPSHQEELSSILREHLNAVGHSVDETTELKELVRICARRQMEGK